MEKYKIFDINYLINEELSEEDLYYISETPSFKYSIIIAEFKEINNNTNPKDIINIITTNNEWLVNNKWSKVKRNNFLNKLTRAYHNVYQYSDNESYQNAQWFLSIYGFDLK